MKRKNKPEFEIKFWKDWLEGDYINRLEMVRNLPIVKEVDFIDGLKMPKKMRKRMFASTLNGFFEDLESAIYVKISLDKKSKKND